MEYVVGSYAEEMNSVLVVLLLSVFPLTGLFLICVGLWTILEFLYGEIELFICISLLLLSVSCGLYCLCVGRAGIMQMLATYYFTSDGLRIKYPLGRIQFEKWDSFQEICICYAAYTTRGKRKANTVICFVKKGEKKALNGRWKTDSLLRYRSVITINFSPIVMEKLRSICPRDVVDLRNTPNYRL